MKANQVFRLTDTRHAKCIKSSGMKSVVPLGNHSLITSQMNFHFTYSVNFYQTVVAKTPQTCSHSCWLPLKNHFLKFNFLHDVIMRRVVSSLVQDHWEWEWFLITKQQTTFPHASSSMLNQVRRMQLLTFPTINFSDQTLIVGLISPYKGLKIRHASLS